MAPYVLGPASSFAPYMCDMCFVNCEYMFLILFYYMCKYVLVYANTHVHICVYMFLYL